MKIEIFCRSEPLNEDGKEPIWTGIEDDIDNIVFEVPKKMVINMIIKDKVCSEYGRWKVKINKE